MAKFISTKKSQIWGIDLMIALTIFLIVIITVYVYVINYYSESKDIIEELSYDGTVVSSLFLSEGSPADWTASNFDTLGVLSEDKINQTKLNELFQLDYEEMKRGFRAKNEFYLNFTEMKINMEIVEGIGKKPENFDNLLKIERF